jgi:DNA topoisomerase IB
MKTLRIVLAKEPATVKSKSKEDAWWESQTKEFQKEYIKLHPGSKYAKNAKASKLSKSAAPGKSGVKSDKPKVKKDPYANVPPEDKEQMVLAKKRGIAIPPAWRKVWLNPDPEGDCQVKAVMWNERKGKNLTQSLYSVNHETRQAALKFERIKVLTKELPSISKQLQKDMETSEEAKVLYLITKMGFRIGGGPEDAGKHPSFGASTLTSDHIKIEGNTVHFDFPGKHGVRQEHSIEDAKIAKMFKGAKGNPGKLFKTNPKKIHKYLDGLSENHFKVHDFRTYVATSTALKEVSTIETKPKTKKEYDKLVLEVCTTVAAKLGNAPEMARDSYVDPTVFKAWADDIDMTEVEPAKKTKSKKEHASSISDAEDEAMLDFVETNHYQFDIKLVKAYKLVKAMPEGFKRKEAYMEFQKMAKTLKMVDVQDRKAYVKSLKDLELALKGK